MARCGAEWGQCRRTKDERAREATPRVENVSVRRGLPSATGPPPAGSRVQVTGQCGRPRSARHRGRARLCPKTYVPRHRRASATAQNGASTWASPPVEARACCQPERVASIINPSVFPGARARTCACAALVWSPAPVRGCTWGHHSATQCQHMTHASRSAAPPTPRSARRGARASTRATQKKAHVAWTALDLERERGLPGRAVLRARRRVRPRARHRGALPTSLPLMVNKKSSGQPKKKFQNFPSPHNTIPRAASATVPPLPASSRTSVQRVLTRLWDGPGHDNGWAAAA